MVVYRVIVRNQNGGFKPDLPHPPTVLANPAQNCSISGWEGKARPVLSRDDGAYGDNKARATLARAGCSADALTDEALALGDQTDQALDHSTRSRTGYEGLRSPVRSLKVSINASMSSTWL